MKLIKIFFVVLFSVLLAVPQFGQSAQRTLVKSFNAKNIESILFELDGNVEVRTWKKDLMRVEMQISLENGNERLLKSMIVANRFNLESNISDSEMTVSIPTLDHQITISGKVINEKISYVVNVPESAVINVLEDETLSLVEKKKKK